MNLSLASKALIFEEIFNGIHSGLILLDAGGRVVLWNDWIAEHSGIPADCALNESLESLFPGGLTDAFRTAVKNGLSRKLPIVLSNALHRSPMPLYVLPVTPHADQRMQQSITITPIGIGDGAHLCLIQVTDATLSIKRELVLRSHSERLTKEAATDGLTGAYNRRTFDQRLRVEIGRAHRQSAPISLLMLDVDFFKNYNDLYGHPAGDKALIAVANALGSGLLRPTDLMARYGGEEFVIILPESGPEGSLIVAERIRAAVSELHIPHDGSAVADHITLSIGIATCLSGMTCNPLDLTKAADAALYQAKNGGRNCVRQAVNPQCNGLPERSVDLVAQARKEVCACHDISISGDHGGTQQARGIGVDSRATGDS